MKDCPSDHLFIHDIRLVLSGMSQPALGTVCYIGIRLIRVRGSLMSSWRQSVIEDFRETWAPAEDRSESDGYLGFGVAARPTGIR